MSFDLNNTHLTPSSSTFFTRPVVGDKQVQRLLPGKETEYPQRDFALRRGAKYLFILPDESVC